MKIVKGVINTLIAFLLTIVILANFGVLLFSNTILNKNYMLSLIEENGYYEKVETDLKNGFQNYEYQSGLPAQVFVNLYTADEVRRDIDSIINCVYDGTEITNNAENVRTRITENINQYLSENSIVLNQEQQQNIDDFEEIMVGVYENKVSSVLSYAKNIHPIIQKLQNAMNMIKFILMAALIAIVMLTLLFNITNKMNFVNVIGISLLSSGVLLELMNYVIKKNIDINNLLLFAQSFSDFVKYIIFNVLSKFTYYGIVFVVVGIVGIIANSYTQGKRNNRI